MRKKSLRFISAALAVSMMASTLPVGAFALEVGAGETTATVSEQKAATSHRLNGNETIDEDFVVANGTVYTLSGNYTQGITIETKQDITINIDDEVTITGVAKFLDVTGTGKVTINGTKGGVDQKIKMTTNFEAVGTGDTGIVYLDAAGADVTCNGGDYYSAETSDVVSTYSVFCVKDGSLKLNEVIAEAGNLTSVVDCGVYTTSSLATVEIQGGTFKAAGRSSGVIDCGNKGTMTINNATLEMHNGGNYVLAACGSSAELKIYNSTVVGENEHSCVTVQFGGSFWAENCKFTSVGNQSYNGGLLFMLSGEATIKDSSYVAKQSGVNGIRTSYMFYVSKGPHKLTVENTEIKGCENALSFGYDPEGSDIKLKNVTFEDNKTDIYLENDENTPANAPHVELDENTKDTAGAITVEVAHPANGVQITTKTTGKDYQQSLKLTSKNDGWLIGYKKDADADGEYRYLTKREGNDYYGLNTINATATTGEGDNVTTLETYAQVKEGTPVNLTANAAPGGKKFARWKVEKVADGTPVTGLLDAETENTENTSFSMPEYDVIITAEYEDEIIVDPGTGDSDYGGDIAAGVVIGGIAAVGAYEVGTGLYRILAMDDVAMPTNRIALAKLLWERAGKPEPESTALYSDISAEDTDAQKAARWAVEQGLMNDAEDGKFHPAFPVSKLRVCLTWENAKQKGLFDKTEA